MATPRSQQFDPSKPPWVHCISRCVRRAFLCGVDRDGRDLDHRKQWVEQRLRLIAGSAACEVAGYAVMSSHLHAVVRMRPDVAADWSSRSVVERWLTLWPRERLADGTPVAPSPEEVAILAQNEPQVARWRARLGDLGWTMKALKEAISRRANKEDGCTGAFWEGRYKSVPLLDQPALVACMAYVDLNPIRAKIADRPERSRFTGAYERIRVRKAVRTAARLRKSGEHDKAAAVLARIDARSARGDAEDVSWLTPLSACTMPGLEGTSCTVSLDEYLTLLDATGRILHEGKRGAIPARLAPILARLELDIDRWLACMCGYRQFIGAAVGRLASRIAEATRRGLRWVQNRCALFACEVRAAS